MSSIETGEMTSRELVVLFIVLCLCGLATSLSDRELQQPSLPVDYTITASFKNEDVVTALEEVANQMGVSLCVGPNVSGLVTVDFDSEHWETAIFELLKGNRNASFELIDGTEWPLGPHLFIKTCEQRTLECTVIPTQLPENPITQKFNLRYGPTSEIADFFENEYPRVHIDFDPYSRAFYARGSVDDLREVRKEVRFFEKVLRSRAEEES